MAGKSLRRRAIWAVVVVVVAVLVTLILRPAQLPVETARVARGALRVSVDEDGETRAHDRFVVAAPIPGRLQRVELEEGDAVRENGVVAAIDPLPLNQQQREEVFARISAAEATKRQADARAAHAQADYELAKRDRARAEQLGRDGVISAQALEQARNAEVTGAEELQAAKFNALAAASEVKVARSGLVGIADRGSPRKVISVQSPIAGKVLRVVEKSERVVQAGAPLVILGDPAKLEIVTDVLTTDAVNIKPGAPVFLEGWGGDHPLRARVRLVEPAGFTKISALGVEEKRVNVIADFVDPPNGLGDGFRVESRIVTWEGERLLKIPLSAAFRSGDAWSVFVVESGRARRRVVEIGHRNQTEVEILRGVSEGDEVILHPSNQMRDGVRVRSAK
ncbi:MAG TPA: HlyD family efflux transporter periplasmic adaptor subunit [Candidatus Acidoferrales bacterium]|nr:HlyD family efflux transporter periplasmic adaptor subunit [Candidatus Acidoferrales bacterium]